MELSNGIQDQIYETMRLRATEELLDIWQTNDRSAWTPEVFEVVKKILMERSVDVPSQGADDDFCDEDGDDEDDEDVESPLKINLLWLSSFAGFLSYTMLFIGILAALASTVSWKITTSNQDVGFLAHAVAFGGAAFTGLFCFITLQFIYKVIPVILDIRSNIHSLTRRTRPTE